MTALQPRHQPRSRGATRRASAHRFEPIGTPLNPMHQLLVARMTAANAPAPQKQYPGAVRFAILVGGAIGSWGLVIADFRLGSLLI
jgi:hypothetical protein